MKKAFLILRIPIETAFGLLYMSALLLLPGVLTGVIPQGYMGMPRIHSAEQLAAVHRFNATAMLIGLLVVTFLVLNGLLWLKDVLQIVRKLRTKQLDT